MKSQASHYRLDFRNLKVNNFKRLNMIKPICFFLLDFWIFVGLEPLLSEKGDGDSGDGGRLNATLTDKDVKGTI